MARVNALIAACLIAWPGLASAGVERWTNEIADASARFAIPRSWIRNVMAAESGGRTTIHGAPVVSRAGAMGLMQLMPATWLEMRALLSLGTDPFDPRDNILADTAYLRAMYDRFGYPGLFAAYNAGPRRYSAYLSKGAPLPSETISYVKATTLIEPPADASSREQAALRPTLFAIHRKPPERLWFMERPPSLIQISR